MLLTFLNLTVIGGLLEGIIVGSLEGTRDKAFGDVIVSPKVGKQYIERTQQIVGVLRNDSRVRSVAPRYSASAEIISESDFYKITDKTFRSKNIRNWRFWSRS